LTYCKAEDFVIFLKVTEEQFSVVTFLDIKITTICEIANVTEIVYNKSR